MRQKRVDEFSAYDGPGALVMNPKAAGVGLNITAANHVIHYNLEWNPAVEDQASARAHRRGQTRVVTVHRLFYAHTVEEVMDDRMQTKRQIADAAIVGTSGRDQEMSDLLRALRVSPIVSNMYGALTAVEKILSANDSGELGDIRRESLYRRLEAYWNSSLP